MDLRIDVTTSGEWSVVQVGGEVDVATAPRLRERLVDLVNHGRHRLVLDLGAVGFIDSTGLGVLIGVLKRIRTVDGSLRLVLVEPHVRKVFEITGLDGVFAIHPTLDDAVGP